MKFTQHPLSAAFPAMGADDFQALKDSIENIGVQNPITLFEGMVIDGWHRYTAATELGMDCPTVELGDVDPRDFAWGQNGPRRHMTSAQLASATAAVYAWYPVVGANQHTKSAPALSAAPQKTTAEMAAIAGVSERSIRQAKAVQTNAAPEVIAAVKSGEIGLPKAAAIAKLPKEEQAAAIAKPIPVAKPDPIEVVMDDGPDEAEMAALVKAQFADAELIQQMLEADDALAYVTNELAKARAQLEAMTASRNGYQNQCAELIKMVKSKDRQIAKLKQVQA